MTKSQKKILLIAATFALCFAFTPVVNAMHIMEGYLPGSFSIAWSVVCIPFIIAGFFSIRKTLSSNRKLLMILAMVGAYAFVLSSLKIPSVTGSCSHMTGTGLGAILFGPSAMSIIGLIVLIFQAILLAHGGLTTLGANTFSMAIAGPFLSWIIYKICQKLKAPKLLSIFLAASLGDLFTYIITSVQLAIAYPAASGGVGASLVKFLGIFATTQIPLAIIEGILTAIVIIGLQTYAKEELTDLRFFKKGGALS